MSNDNKKASFIGASAFDFIAKIASKSLVIDSAETSNESVAEQLVDLNANEIRLPQVLQEEKEEIDLTLKNQTQEEKKEELLEEILDNNKPISLKLLSKSTDDEYMTRENYLKGCKWSPDGTCIVTNSDDSVLRIYDTTVEMLNSNNEENPTHIKSSLKLTESSLIYDYTWYPFMNSSDPTTCCLFATSKENPVHLFDAYTGKIRCSYKGYNHVDELDTAYSIAFNQDCSKIYCGYKKCIKVFDITRPGKNYEDIPIGRGQYKLPGIVSCISYSPVSDIYAAGTYAKYIGIYVAETNEPISLVEAHSGGLTHLMFSSDGNKLYSGARKDSNLYCWDMRNPGKILQVFKRDVQTNQRIYFDLIQDKYLCSGNNTGTIRFWNANEFDLSVESEPELNEFKVHDDCVNGVSFNVQYSLLATSSGQRKFLNASLNSSSSDSDDENKSESATFENSLKIWKF